MARMSEGAGRARMEAACYRKLHRYKYQLMEPYVHDIQVRGHAVETPYLALEASGQLEIKRTYAWDGPSGPTRDTCDFMRGSLVHDAIYQLIRMEVLPRSCRQHADRLLRTVCQADRMGKLRSWIVYFAVRWFGGSSARPGTEKPDPIICAPPS